MSAIVYIGAALLTPTGVVPPRAGGTGIGVLLEGAAGVVAFDIPPREAAAASGLHIVERVSAGALCDLGYDLAGP